MNKTLNKNQHPRFVIGGIVILAALLLMAASSMIDSSKNLVQSPPESSAGSSSQSDLLPTESALTANGSQPGEQGDSLTVQDSTQTSSMPTSAPMPSAADPTYTNKILPCRLLADPDLNPNDCVNCVQSYPGGCGCGGYNKYEAMEMVCAVP